MCIFSIYGYNVCLFAVFDDSEDDELYLVSAAP